MEGVRQIVVAFVGAGAGSSEVAFWFGLMIAVALLGGLLYLLGSQNRYEEMTEEEFEQEARNKSMLGAAITGLEGALRKREATVLMEAKRHLERDATPASGEPPRGAPEKEERDSPSKNRSMENRAQPGEE